MTPKWLEDIVDCSEFVLGHTASRTLADYEADLRLHSAVERNVGIIGEALSRIERIDPETAARLTGVRRLVEVRARLIHEYDSTDHAVVWGVIQDLLPGLKVEAEALLAEAEADF